MKPKLHTFSKEDYQSLLASGMMWEFYPEATGDYYQDVTDSSCHGDCINTNELKWEMVSDDGRQLEMVNTRINIDEFISKMSIIYKSLGFQNDLIIKALGASADSNRNYIIRPNGTDIAAE